MEVFPLALSMLENKAETCFCVSNIKRGMAGVLGTMNTSGCYSEENSIFEGELDSIKLSARGGNLGVDHEGPCSKYCKRLNAVEQAKIVRELLKRDEMDVRTAVISNTLKSRDLLKRYIVNAKWWRCWCDYVNFNEQQSSSEVTKKTGTQKTFGKLQNHR